ncbi:MAG: DUF4249 domain-containing protein [Bacteroidota bacterium]
MKKYRTYFLAVMGCILAACQTDLDIPFPEHTPRLVLNSYLVEDGSFYLYVTRSFSALEDLNDANDSVLLIQDAEVSIWSNDEKLGEFEFVNTPFLDTIEYYTFNPTTNSFDTLQFINELEREVFLPKTDIGTPEAGKTYEFRASHPTYGEAKASVTVLPPPKITNVQIVKDSLQTQDFDGYRDRWTAVKITVEDPGEFANYYSFSVKLRYSETFDDLGSTFTDTFENDVWISTELTRDADGVYYGNNKPLSDLDFNGQSSTLLAWINLPGCCGYASDLANQPEREFFSLEVGTFTFDATMGVFKEKHDLQRTSRTEGIQGAIIPREPVSVVGNVEGGYGLVSSFHFSSIKVDF